MIDKREWRRVNVDVPGKVYLEAREVTVRLVDINHQGVCFTGEHAFQPGDRMDLEICVPECAGLRVPVETVWSGFMTREGHYRTGVCVADGPGETTAVLREKFLRYYNFLLLRHPPA